MMKVCIALAVLIGLTGVNAYAERFPTQPIRMIIPFAAGGASDSLARIVARHLEKEVGQPVIPENMAGAGGILAGQTVARAKPDGYTVLFGTIGTNAILPVVQGSSLKYDSLKDLLAVAPLHELPLVLIVQKSIAMPDARSLVEYAKNHPGKLTFGSSGIGSVQHLSGELFNARAHIDTLHVPFKGGGAAVPALLGDQISMIFEPMPSAMSAVRSGRVLALGVTSETRSASWPDLPTLKEQGLAGMEINAWTGLFAPAGTSSEVVDRLRTAISNLSRNPLYLEQLASAGTSPVVGGYDRFPAFVESEVRRWKSVAQQAGIAAQ